VLFGESKIFDELRFDFELLNPQIEKEKIHQTTKVATSRTDPLVETQTISGEDEIFHCEVSH
jgi:hypothetical protein